MVVVVEETVLQYPYFEGEEKKELHLSYDIQNRIAGLKQIKTVTTINYIKHFAYGSIKLYIFLGGTLQKNECSDIYRVNPKHITHLILSIVNL